MKGQIPAVVATATLGMLLVSAASADDKDEKNDRDSGSQKSCVDLARLRSTTVVDDQTILFNMRNGDVLLNYLPQSCPNLGQEQRFTYRVTANRLCDLDTITVLQDFGLGLAPGATCRLGSFNPITKEAAEDIKAGPRKPLVRTEQVEPIKRDDDRAADSGGADARPANDDDGAASANDDGSASGEPAASSADDESSPRESRRERRRRARAADGDD